MAGGKRLKCVALAPREEGANRFQDMEGAVDKWQA